MPTRKNRNRYLDKKYFKQNTSVKLTKSAYKLFNGIKNPDAVVLRMDDGLPIAMCLGAKPYPLNKKYKKYKKQKTKRVRKKRSGTIRKRKKRRPKK